MLPYTDWLIGHSVSLEEMLAGRESRAARQAQFLTRGYTLLCFTLNLAGPVKVFPLSKELFRLGDVRIRRTLARRGFPVLEAKLQKNTYGWEGYYQVDAPAQDVKKVMITLEENVPEGRLFDLDVLDESGAKLSRSLFGLPARSCLICGSDGMACSRSRAHTVEQLQEKSVSLMLGAVRREGLSPELMGELCHMALLHEVYTTPKPGLVDRSNTGAHQDMDVSLFEKSAAVLESYFADTYRIGQQFCDLPPCQMLAHLREAGIQAEADMKHATCGVNTHKGAIFSFGLLCAAFGQLNQRSTQSGRPDPIDTDEWLEWAGAIAAPALRQDFNALSGRLPATAGERQYCTAGLLGVRGEAASGFQSVRTYSWPALLRCLKKGQTLEQAGVTALMELIAHVSDSNVIARGGIECANQLRSLVQAQRAAQHDYPTQWVEALDQTLIAWGVSPGGCADLLAVTYLLALLADLGQIKSSLLPRCDIWPPF